MADPEAERAIIAEIDACKKTGDTLGGVVEVTVTGLPVAWAVMSSGIASWTAAWPSHC